MADFYPKSMDAKATWHATFFANLAPFITKYGLGAGTLGIVSNDNDWIQYWVQARNDANTLSQTLTKYFNDIAGNDKSLDAPNPIVFALTGSAPDEVPPGIEYRTREIARQIKNHADYSQADGELLGIVAPEITSKSLAEMTPEYTAKTLANFEVEITFRKFGMDALKFEFRRKGSDWQSAGFLVTSPGKLSIPPSTPGEGEQVELRATYVLKNDDVGNYTDAKGVFIAA